LFPFLAVLICTMGALMLLLLLVTRQARLQAASETAAKDAEKQSSIAAELEMVQWRVEQLKNSRKETESQLAEARLVLGHIEDHGRRLRDQFQDLSRQAKQAADEGLKPGRFVAAGEAELRHLEGQIAEAQQRLAQAQQAAANRPKSYAIVPYDGPNRTRRRPIYIECRGDAVVLQPEAIVFNEDDFDEPLGPGNPLAAAIRAAREQMLLQGSADPQSSGEPYPLLLVRPAGIPAYDCALAAMKSWGSEFGYELINADWELKYPPPDPNLKKSVDQAVFLARQEHARLIAAAPSKYGKRPRAGAYRSPLGGDGSGQGGAGEGESPGFYSSKPSERYGRDYAGDGSAETGRRSQVGGSSEEGGTGGTGSGSGGHGRSSGPGGASGGGGSGNDPYGDAEFVAHNPYASLPAPGTGGSPSVNSGGMGSGSGYGPGNGMSGPPGSAVANGAGGSPAANSGGVGSGWGNGPGNLTGGGPGSGVAVGGGGSPAMNPGGNGSTPGSGVSSGPAGSSSPNPGGVANYSNTANAVGVQNNYTSSGNQAPYQPNGQPAGGPPGTPGIARPDGYINGRPSDGNPPPAPVRPDTSSSVAMAPAAPLRPGEWRPSEETNPPKRDRDEEEKEKKKHPYDKVKLDHSQDDWALRNATRHAAAISRPIHVDCYIDRVVLVPEMGSGEARVIPCDRGGQRDADKIVAAVWEIMDTWGMAGREMYWRPVLNFHVVPGAEPRMLDITRSLEGSGLVIERKQ